MDHELRIRDQPGQHSETLSLLKHKKLAGPGGMHLQFQLLRRLRQENCLLVNAGVNTHVCFMLGPSGMGLQEGFSYLWAAQYPGKNTVS